MNDKPQPHFNGPEYKAKFDQSRLSTQHLKIRDLMIDGQWRTLGEIAQETGYREASISAQLRHLRKERFGSYTVDRRARGDRTRGLFEYRVVKQEPDGAPPDHSEPTGEDDGDVQRLVAEHEVQRS